jgi:hypothetical protein
VPTSVPSATPLSSLATVIKEGDFFVSLSDMPASVLIRDSTFANSRASGMIIHCHNARSVCERLKL